MYGVVLIQLTRRRRAMFQMKLYHVILSTFEKVCKTKGRFKEIPEHFYSLLSTNMQWHRLTAWMKNYWGAFVAQPINRVWIPWCRWKRIFFI